MLLSFGVIAIPFNNADELWNYNFARNIFDGLLPYKDFNMVQTPLSAYIGALFLGLFGNEMFSLRIASAILMAATFSVLYKLSFDFSKNRAISLVAILFTFTMHFGCWIYSYNTLNLFILLLVFNSEYKQLCSDDFSFKKNLIIGILIGLTPLIKQTTGLFFLVANVVLVCIYCWCKNMKKLIGILRVFISGIPLYIYSIFLSANP